MDLRWFCDEIEELAERLSISEERASLPPGAIPPRYPEPVNIVLTHVNGATNQNEEPVTPANENASTRHRSKWTDEGPIEFATEAEAAPPPPELENGVSLENL